MNGDVRKVKAFAVSLVAIVLLCTATSARADLIITVQEDSGTTFTIVSVSGSPTSNLLGAGSKDTAHYSVVVDSGFSSQDPSGTFSELLSSALRIRRLPGETSLTHVLHIVVTGTKYTAPITPPDILVASSIGGAIVKGSAGNSLIFHSIVGGTDVGPQTPSITTMGAYLDAKTLTLTSLSAPFTISETFDITLRSLGDELGYSSQTSLTSVVSVPEASSTLLLAVGLMASCILLRCLKGKEGEATVS